LLGRVFFFAEVSKLWLECINLGVSVWKRGECVKEV